MHLNVEIKTKTDRQQQIRDWLLTHDADFKGTDHQVDTYFNCPNGRLKLREGTIEHSLIFYQRVDQIGPKRSEVYLYHPPKDPNLKELLVAAHGVWKIVDKRREIYFIKNVKFHLDKVENLGTFVEIEAIDQDGSLGEEYLQQQCSYYMREFSIETDHLINISYSDMV